MRPQEVELGRDRTPQDGCRRYRPVVFSFDSRSITLNQVIEPTWEPAIQEQWRTNQAAIRMELLAEHGTVRGEAKIDNFMTMGPAPWSIVHEHNHLLIQIRSAFTHGDFYPALVGSCSLGERILNELIRALTPDYINHRATTKRARTGKPLTDWDAAIAVLHGWGVLSDSLAQTFRQLKERRHQSVHFEPSLLVAEREPALEALAMLQELIGAIFSPIGGPPRFVADAPGAAFLALAAEQEPLIKRIFLPRSVLVSPAHRLYPKETSEGIEFLVVDDADYDPTPLTDADYAAALPAGTASMHPEFQS
jgi:hypothetical protein